MHEREALKLLVQEMEYVLTCINAHKVPFDGDDFHEALRLGREALAQPEQPKQNTVEAVKAVLKGIDQTEIESPDGWWETSAGAEFGAKKLKYVIGLLAQPEQEPYAWEFAGTIFHDRKEVFDWYERDDISDIPPLALYTTPPQRKPLTHEQRFDLLTKFEPHKNKWEAPAILIDMVEAAHGIKGDA